MSEDLDFQQQIVAYIRRNRVSSTEVADCLGKTGAIPGVRPVKPGSFSAGKVQWVYTWEESNWPVHEQLADVREGDILLVEGFDCKGRAIFGDLVSKYLILYRQALAVVVMGTLRDAHRLTKEGWPIWCEGFTPIGCFNRKPETELDPAVVEEHRNRYEGSVAVCDDSGVVVIPREHHNEEFLGKLAFIEEQEDIWYECIDRRKWNTFDTVCLKKYKDEGGVAKGPKA